MVNQTELINTHQFAKKTWDSLTELAEWSQCSDPELIEAVSQISKGLMMMFTFIAKNMDVCQVEFEK